MARMTIQAALEQLAAEKDAVFTSIFSRNGLSLEIYKPVAADLQQPHSRDEIYVVISGRGEFVNGGERHGFEPGEVLFVPAGTEHRFENFSDDFATWVLFFGPEIDAELAPAV